MLKAKDPATIIMVSCYVIKAVATIVTFALKIWGEKIKKEIKEMNEKHFLYLTAALGKANQ